MHKQHSSLSRTLIVAALAIAVGAVVYMKQRPLPEQAGAPVKVREAAGAPEKTPAPLPRLVDLGSNKCQSCLAMVPVLEALTEEYKGRLKVEFIDIWQNPAEADRFSVKLIPTQVFLDADGKELFRHEGFFSREDIMAKWKELGFKFDG